MVDVAERQGVGHAGPGETLARRDLPRAIAAVSAVPAAIAGLDDRGRIAPGLRADLVRFKALGPTPVIAAVWSQGQRAF